MPFCVRGHSTPGSLQRALADRRHLPPRLAGPASADPEALAVRKADCFHGRPRRDRSGLASPIEPFAALLLQVHMLQHLLLMMGRARRSFGWERLSSLCFGDCRKNFAGTGRARLSLAHAPAVLWSGHPSRRRAASVHRCDWLWHTPSLYELALESSEWHYFQHACFLGDGLLFWYPVIRPYPSRPRWSPWLLVPYLIVADGQNTLLSALLTFSSHVWFPYYLGVPRVAGISVLADQAAAGGLMWVFGSVAFLLPLFAIGIRLLYGDERNVTNRFAAPARCHSQ